MKNFDWKSNLLNLFEDIKVIEKCKEETLENFDQFCEFIAEPAFENLADELKKYRIRSKFKRSKWKSIDFQISFPGSSIDNFHYIICLPKNSMELKLKLELKGRKNKNSLLEKREEVFKESVKPSELLKLPKEEIIQDVIEHYKNFAYETLAKPE